MGRRPRDSSDRDRREPAQGRTAEYTSQQASGAKPLMRRRIVSIIAGLAAAAAVSLPAAAMTAPAMPTPADNPPPQVCVWENGVWVSGYLLPVYVGYTCTP